MIINRLELNNFRNYESLDLSLSPDINIIYGDNAQGKTNILEAVYLCCTTKSHKNSKEKDMIRIGYDESHLRMSFIKNDLNHRIDMHLKKNGRKGVAVDGVPASKSSEVYGLTNVVLFSPEDLSIVKDGPAERRHFMDAELCQLNKSFLKYLSLYNKTLDQRNNLLKQIPSTDQQDLISTLDVWDEKLVEYGSKIIQARADFIREINSIAKEVHNDISNGAEELTVDYEPNVLAEEYQKALFSERKKDIYQKTTSVGPHRDDFSLYAGKENLRLFGSQGQQRTAALSLKLSEIRLVREKIGESPILLLDDVLSELDRNRQHSLLNFIEGVQTVITCTGLEEFVGYRKKINTLFKVTKGHIEKIQ